MALNVQKTIGDHQVGGGNQVARGIGLDLSPWFWMVAGLVQGLVLDTGKHSADVRALQVSNVHQLPVQKPVGGRTKRALDIVVASVALLLLSPLMLLASALIYWNMGAPITYAHTRVGYRGRLFDCMKFRTMVTNGDEVLSEYLANNPEARHEWVINRKLTNDPRVTWLGRFLRKTSIDELPQLINVLRGEMSCVGPRPIVQDELAKYGPHARHYLRAVPGLTGIWQVSGRSSTTYRRRVVMDVSYVRRKWTLKRELWILLLTLPAVLPSKDAV